jgi:ribulose-5-phosphate 4-epimerase/fuculose-1-phosphate aldolase
MNFLNELVQLSQYAAKPYWVQGPGGNTSVKDNEDRMWVKASGVLLGEVSANAGWVQTDLLAIKEILKKEGLSGREPGDIALINETVNNACIQTATNGLRPSMETAFHSLYHRYVLHTHHAFANIFLCSDHADDIHYCLPNTGECFASLASDYYTPGAELSWMLYDMFRFEEAMPQITLLPNHGIIISANTLVELFSVHDAFHARLCSRLQLNDHDYPGYTLQQEENRFVVNCNYLQKYFSNAGEQPPVFYEYLVPDLAVYLYPEYYSCTNSQSKIYFNPQTNIIQINASRREAITLTELMIYAVFLHEQITARNFEPLTINFDTGKLRNMGAEKYRRKAVGE